MPILFILTDIILMFIALVWICNSLKKDPKVMGNERWMAVIMIMLALLLVLHVRIAITGEVASDVIPIILECIISLVTVLIMDQVNQPRKYVYANNKFDGNSSTELLSYID
jgi:hypothetical protein